MVVVVVAVVSRFDDRQLPISVVETATLVLSPRSVHTNGIYVISSICTLISIISVSNKIHGRFDSRARRKSFSPMTEKSTFSWKTHVLNVKTLKRGLSDARKRRSASRVKKRIGSR